MVMEREFEENFRTPADWFECPGVDCKECAFYSKSCDRCLLNIIYDMASKE